MRNPISSLLNSTALKRERTFAQDSSGNIAMITGICVIPLVLLIGFAVDYRRATNDKAAAQSALDAAVLVGGKTMAESTAPDQTQKFIEAKVAANLMFDFDLRQQGGTNPSIDPTFMLNGDNEFVGTYSTNTELFFGDLLGRDFMQASVMAAATVGSSRNLEVALVLDNSTSMFTNTRMEDMRAAAKGFVSDIYVASDDPENVRISVIPYAGTLNINSEAPGTWDPATSPSVLETPAPTAAGTATLPATPMADRRQYVGFPDTNSSISSSQLADLFLPVEWRGCIWSHPGERRVTPSGSVPASHRLSDAPPTPMRWPVNRIPNEEARLSVSYGTPPPPPPPSPGPPPPPPPSPGPPPPPPPPPGPPPPPMPGVQGDLNLPWDDLFEDDKWLPRPETELVSAPPYYYGFRPNCWQTHVQDYAGPPAVSIPGGRNSYVPTTRDCSDDSSMYTTGTLPACVADPNEFEYIADGNAACSWMGTDWQPWDQQRPIVGPNLNCPTAMLGLSSDPAQLYAKLDHMYPVPAGTKVDVGLMWGLRALSDRDAWANFWGHPLTAKPAAFDDASTRKVMVLLTDGENQMPFHYEGYYGCMEFGSMNGRWWSPPCRRDGDIAMETGGNPDFAKARQSLDALTLDACDRIRNEYNIELYVIAVDVSDATALTVLESCAGSSSRFFDVGAADLDDVFANLAASSLRLSQ